MGNQINSIDYTAVAAMIIAAVACIMVLGTFDRHSTNIRRTVLIAVLTALSVVSRYIFMAIPVKPMMAIVIFAGIYLGKEAGFFCGAFTALISNFGFGQGPWTPFQMAAFGLLGLLGGMSSRKLLERKIWLVIYAVFAGIMYSFVVDVWTVLWYNGDFKLSLYAAAMITAMPYTLMYVVSNIIFLLIFEKSMGRKMYRIIQKYQI